MLVDKQVESANSQDGPLCLRLDVMALGIRQFMTHDEFLRREGEKPSRGRFYDFEWPPDARQAYFDALEILRSHLSRCLEQVATIGGIVIPKEGLIAHYKGNRQRRYISSRSFLARDGYSPGRVDLVRGDESNQTITVMLGKVCL